MIVINSAVPVESIRGDGLPGDVEAILRTWAFILGMQQEIMGSPFGGGPTERGETW